MIIDCHLLYSTKKFSGAGWNTCDCMQLNLMGCSPRKGIKARDKQKSKMKWATRKVKWSKWQTNQSSKWQKKSDEVNSQWLASKQMKRVTSNWVTTKWSKQQQRRIKESNKQMNRATTKQGKLIILLMHEVMNFKESPSLRCCLLMFYFYKMPWKKSDNHSG